MDVGKLGEERLDEITNNAFSALTCVNKHRLLLKVNKSFSSYNRIRICSIKVVCLFYDMQILWWSIHRIGTPNYRPGRPECPQAASCFWMLQVVIRSTNTVYCENLLTNLIQHIGILLTLKRFVYFTTLRESGC